MGQGGRQYLRIDEATFGTEVARMHRFGYIGAYQAYLCYGSRKAALIAFAGHEPSGLAVVDSEMAC